ncbi:MAG: PQQ-binding-like beta-propeller repeat protein, partial [Planctomycetaceae bacterium]|nr:PQQ-binding-like beta-propeller repeat protein [Planctomycetaceae bacterium]
MLKRTRRVAIGTGAILLLVAIASLASAAGEEWLQFKYDARHSGDVAERSVGPSLGLVGAVPLTDGIYASPVIADGRIYVVDGSGVAFCIDAKSLEVVWKVATQGGAENCNNVSSPAIVGR